MFAFNDLYSVLRTNIEKCIYLNWLINMKFDGMTLWIRGECFSCNLISSTNYRKNDVRVIDEKLLLVSRPDAVDRNNVAVCR